MKKILLGGSPCTFWSIAQKNNRETEPSGLGWELFKNYLIAKEKFKPDIFLYENNRSAAEAIKAQIRKELKVDEGEAKYIEINSALVSAQNRQRFYVHNCGDVGQPEDKGITLKDIIDHCCDGCPVCVQEQVYGRKALADGSYDRRYEAREDGKSGALTGTNRQNAVAEPVLFQKPRGKNNGGVKYDKTPTLTAGGRWEENNFCVESARCGGNIGDCETIQKALPKIAEKYGHIPENFNAYNLAEIKDKAPTLSTGSMATSSCAVDHFERVCSKTKSSPVYEVRDGLITVNGKQYPIKLDDGYYIIRKFTVNECERLQTLPVGYCRAVSDTQAYKAIGNGWTKAVIIHILGNALKDVPKDEEIIVLSMYDGIATGRLCLDEMGFTNVKYYAYEIDKYAIQITASNYPDVIQCGDAFQLRSPAWRLGVPPVSLLQGDCLELMKSIPDGSVDMVLCDLPYGATKNKNDKPLPFPELWEQYKRIVKQNGCIALFGQGLFYIDLVCSNRKMFRYDLIWDKVLTSGFLNAKKLPLRRHEQVAIFYRKPPTYNPQFTTGKPLHSKGTAYLNKESANRNYGEYKAIEDVRKGSTQKYPTSIISFQKPHPRYAKHETQKSVALCEWLIKTYTNEGDVVLDNCMGSGTTGVACVRTGRNFIGIEIDDGTFETAQREIQEAKNER